MKNLNLNFLVIMTMFVFTACNSSNEEFGSQTKSLETGLNLDSGQPSIFNNDIETEENIDANDSVVNVDNFDNFNDVNDPLLPSDEDPNRVLNCSQYEKHIRRLMFSFNPLFHRIIRVCFQDLLELYLRRHGQIDNQTEPRTTNIIKRNEVKSETELEIKVIRD
jgi:hypothetical protein